MRTKRIVQCLTIFASLTTMMPTAQAVPITFNTALAISEEEWLVRQQLIIAKVHDDPTLLGREFDALTSVSVAGYGLTKDLAIFGILPYAHKTLKTPAGTRSTSGFGDAKVFARYTLYQNDAPGQTFRISPFLGVELPTGENRATDNLGLIPVPVQAGSGSWDMFGGLVMTYGTTDWQVDSSVSYQDNSKADGVEIGNVFKADLSLQYRLWPTELTDDVNGFLFGILEANFIHEDKTEIGSVANLDSGGTTLFLSPGLQYATKDWIAEASVQIPVYQNLGGTRLEKDYIARASVRFNF